MQVWAISSPFWWGMHLKNGVLARRPRISQATIAQFTGVIALLETIDGLLHLVRKPLAKMQHFRIIHLRTANISHRTAGKFPPTSVLPSLQVSRARLSSCYEYPLDFLSCTSAIASSQAPSFAFVVQNANRWCRLSLSWVCRTFRGQYES